MGDPLKYFPAWVVALIFFIGFVGCDCGGSSDSADGGASTDDDFISGDDSIADDDGDDDASTTSTTTTTTATTTSTSSSTSSTTTTSTMVVTTTSAPTTSSTTTTTQPGDGTMCNPFVVDPEEIVPEQPYGPWPEVERDGVILRQILANSAGEGMNGIVATSDGLVHIVGVEGISLDVWTIDGAGNISRETIHPFGGETKLIGKDSDDHLYVVYSYTRHGSTSALSMESVRYATNKSGEWESTTMVEIDAPDPIFDLAVAPDTGVVHLIYKNFFRNDDNVYYASYENGVFSPEVIATPDWAGWLNIAVDASGSPHLMYYDPEGTHYLRRVDGNWVGEIATPVMAPWDLLIDEAGVAHMAADADSDFSIHHGTRTVLGWEFELVDDCYEWMTSVSLSRDATGSIHFVYSDENGSAVKYATNASGEWVYTRLGPIYEQKTAWDMASTVDSNGHVHVVHRQEYDTPESLFYDTNESGVWKRYTLAALHLTESFSSALDEAGILHVLSRRDLERYMVYGVLENDTWTWEIMDDGGATSTMALRQDVQLGTDGIVRLLWGNNDAGYLRFAEKTALSWNFNDIDTNNVGYYAVLLAVDGEGDSHVAYSGSDGVQSFMRYSTNVNGNWASENLGFESMFGDLVLDNNRSPVVVFLGRVDEDNGAIVARRSLSGEWSQEMANTMSNGGFMSLKYSDDDSLHLLDDGTPDGFYSTDLTGNWETDSVPFRTSLVSNRIFILDSLNKIHIITDSNEASTPDGDQNAVLYATNKNDNWEYAPLFWGKTFGRGVSLHRKTDGNYLGVIFVGNSYWSVTFDDGIVP